MNCSDVVRRLGCHVVDICAVILADHTEELCQINLIVICSLDCRSHLSIRRVTDNDALASCCSKLLYRSGNLLRYMALVNILNLYT